MLRRHAAVVVLIVVVAVVTTAFGQCRDTHPNCEFFKSLDLCANAAQQPIMKYNCAASCGFCGRFVGTCEDRLQDCAGYKRNGLCTADDTLRVEYGCAKTCDEGSIDAEKLKI
ncbi:unnamed protein product [Caenorhabditis bovis]|uniref:ShKT domain-containing protein n=1 Tax=Caenorhabditis bovis TaxID=2654633 RepID=A0A8S1EG79_9PELO|nr:unnamed protein product [Caenorhabditis bovis]